MDSKQLIKDIAGLYPLVVKIGKKDPDALKELNRVHKAVFGTTVVAGCSGCHVKAYNKLASLTLEDLLIMENAKFKLKKGVLLNYPFMSGNHYSKEGGIPDAVAAKYLEANPDNVSQFDVYPGSDKGKLDIKAIGEISKIAKAAKVDTGKAKKSKADEPKGDEPKDDEPKGDEPKGDEPKGDEPKGDEPKGDEPKGELDVPKKTLSKMNSKELRAEYLDVLFVAAPETATNKEMVKAITAELNKK